MSNQLKLSSPDTREHYSCFDILKYMEKMLKDGYSPEEYKKEINRILNRV